MTTKHAPTTAPAPAQPPHGGRWLRKQDGSLELLSVTKPAEGRVQRDAPPAATEPQSTTEE